LLKPFVYLSDILNNDPVNQRGRQFGVELKSDMVLHKNETSFTQFTCRVEVVDANHSKHHLLNQRLLNHSVRIFSAYEMYITFSSLNRGSRRLELLK
jgi:hypothetical protein